VSSDVGQSRSVNRLAELDGLRGLATAMVVVWHYIPCQILPSAEPALASLGRSLSLTWSGVDLFFVLSGYLIGGVVLDRGSDDQFLFKFYFRRMCRTLPLYFILVCLYLVLKSSSLNQNYWLFGAQLGSHAPTYFNELPAYCYLFLVQNYCMGGIYSFGGNWLGITWSLAIEEQFYLVIPLAAFITSRRWMIAIIFVSCLVVAYFRSYFGLLGSLVYTFCRADALLLGVFCANLVRSATWESNPDWSRLGVLATALLTAAWLQSAIYRGSPFGGAELHLSLACFYASLLLIVVTWQGRWVCYPLRSRSLVWLGRRSYGAYLFHQSVNGLVVYFMLGQIEPKLVGWQSVAALVISLIITLVIAALAYRYVERPAMSFAGKYAVFSR
jgi:peptidoglycan/LPS O-acetylase OafA/YrhL